MHQVEFSLSESENDECGLMKRSKGDRWVKKSSQYLVTFHLLLRVTFSHRASLVASSRISFVSGRVQCDEVFRTISKINAINIAIYYKLI